MEIHVLEQNIPELQRHPVIMYTHKSSRYFKYYTIINCPDILVFTEWLLFIFPNCTTTHSLGCAQCVVRASVREAKGWIIGGSLAGKDYQLGAARAHINQQGIKFYRLPPSAARSHPCIIQCYMQSVIPWTTLTATPTGYSGLAEWFISISCNNNTDGLIFVARSVTESSSKSWLQHGTFL